MSSFEVVVITFTHWYQGVQLVLLDGERIATLSQEVPNWFTFRYNDSKWNISHPYQVVECLKELPEFSNKELRIV